MSGYLRICWVFLLIDFCGSVQEAMFHIDGLTECKVSCTLDDTGRKAGIPRDRQGHGH